MTWTAVEVRLPQSGHASPAIFVITLTSPHWAPARVTSQSGPRTGAASPADQPLTLPRSTRAHPPIPAVRIVRVRDPLPLV